MPYGYNGKILRVNLSEGRLTTEEPDDVFYRTYFGGRNFVAYYLLKEMKPGVDPLGPENKLVFAAGPVTGAPLGGSGRNSIGAKSPLTGAYGDAEVGGYFGAELKHAGFDAIVVEGQASKPVYLLIVDGKVELRDAGHLWGLDTGKTEITLRQELGEKLLRTATIGPAGERLVRFATVMNDVSHAAGRTGMGAVMGSKKLKAIAVRGKGGPPMAEPAKVRELAKWMVEHWKDYVWRFHDTGTAGGLRALDLMGGLPTLNFREGTFEGAEKITGEVMRDTILVNRGSCWACPVRCKREVKVGEPWNVDPLYGGPEYESLSALGSNCGIDDLLALAKANEMCAAYGLDTISTGSTIAFAMDCFENGLLGEKDTDGIRFTFGNTEAMLKAVEAIAYRQGFGDILAEGSARMAAQIGSRADEFRTDVKGQEVPMHEPRLKAILGVGYAVSPTGGDHCHNVHDTLFIKPGPDLDRLKALGILEPMPADELSDNKVRLLAYEGTWRTALNTFVTCMFLPWHYGRMTEVINAVTGWNTTFFEVFKVGERAVNLPRVFNLREGLTAEDDKLPKRFFTPHSRGPLAGFIYDEDRVERTKRKFYEMMGWTPEGVPTPAKLAELSIAWAGEELPQRRQGER